MIAKREREVVRDSSTQEEFQDCHRRLKKLRQKQVRINKEIQATKSRERYLFQKLMRGE